jgi:ParB-like chromosome segregation protein Spo0J
MTHDHDESAVVRVPIDALVAGQTPRLLGESEEHIRTLAETDAELPPVIVQQSSMRVIDGMHRLRAARLRGDTTIAVRFVQCDHAEAFVRSVQVNMAHGLPLSRADRAAAAERILDLYPQWSDRRVSRVCGLAPKTVASIRSAAGSTTGERERLGSDGRVRPLNSTEGRRRASDYLSENPGASVREIARVAGISPSTALDVRNEVLAGAGRTRPTGRPTKQQERIAYGAHAADRSDPRHLIGRLREDPSLRYSERGRALLRWLELRTVMVGEWERLIHEMPPHCSFVVADVAKACAAQWKELALRLEQRIHDDTADQRASG